MDFILGYMLPILPIALIQTMVCYSLAVLLGLSITVNILYGILGMIPVAVFYIGLGLLCGSVLGVKQVGGICGALLTNLSGWLSGVWFDLDLVGGTFRKIANVLPFVHSVEMERALLAGDFQGAASHVIPVLLYGVGTTVLAVYFFLRQMNRQ